MLHLTMKFIKLLSTFIKLSTGFGRDSYLLQPLVDGEIFGLVTSGGLKRAYRYFMHGACRFGTACPFSHQTESAQLSTLCKYYMKGSCSYGNKCRYDHVRADKVEFERAKAQELKKPTPVQNTAPRLPIEDSKDLTFTNLSLLKAPKSELNADAAVFVPKENLDNTVTEDVSYAQAVGQLNPCSEEFKTNDPNSELCPFFLWSGICQFGETCSYIHGDVCDICQQACLHPSNQEQRKQHERDCVKIVQDDMEQAFADARSKDKQCGICMDTVWERATESKQRFGILENCSHCYCVDCIRTWRQSKQFDNKIIRSCPECRVHSDYIIPSRVWIDDTEEKRKLVDEYRNALSKKHCKHFNRGKGECPFGNKCFYRHELPDGTKKDVGPPKRKKRFDESGELHLDIESFDLRDYLEERSREFDHLRESLVRLLTSVDLLGM